MEIPNNDKMSSENDVTRHWQTRPNAIELPGPLDNPTKCSKCTLRASEEEMVNDLETVLADHFQDTCTICTIWKRCIEACQAADDRVQHVVVTDNHIQLKKEPGIIYEFRLYKDPGEYRQSRHDHPNALLIFF
jgi:hypothetical protein